MTTSIIFLPRPLAHAAWLFQSISIPSHVSRELTMIRTSLTPAAFAAALVLPFPTSLAAQRVRTTTTITTTTTGVARDTVERWPTGTFSILAVDPATGEIGAAVQSRVFSVGNGVLWAEAGVGAAATQAVVDVGYGPRALELLKQGITPEQVVKSIWASDPDPRPQGWTKEGRQFAVIDANGNVYAYTGPKAPAAAAHKSCTAPNAKCTAQGNTLAGPAVVDSMVAFFERTPGHLSFRLLAALEGGQLAGGDRRGQQSAAMVIVKKDAGVWLHNDTVLRLQVDDNPEPIKELRRLVELAATQRQRSR